MKKDIEWMKEEISEILLTSKKDGTNYFYYRDLKEKIYNAIDQLDKPEVLSQEWIDEHKKGMFMDNKGRKKNFVWVDDLQGLFVLKQGEVDQSYKDGYEEGKQHGFYKGYREGLADKGSEPETVSDVVADFYEACERLQGVMSMEVEEN